MKQLKVAMKRNNYYKKNVTMKTMHLKLHLFLPFLFLMLFSACQEEVTEITEPDNDETIAPNSNLANLMRNIATNDGSRDNIIDYANCLEVELPVTVIANGIQITVESEDGFDAIEAVFDEFDTDEDSIGIIFPITIISSNYSEIVIENQESLDTLISNCNGEDEDDDDIECIDFQYPIAISMYNTDFQVIDTVAINNDEALYLFIENLDGGVLASINFPVTMVLTNGDTLVVENNTEMEAAIEAAQDDCDEDDDYDWNDDDDDDDCAEEFITSALIECIMVAHTYDASGNIVDENYLEFNASGEVIVNGTPAVTEVGSWSLAESGSGYVLTMDGLITFDLLNGEWLLLDCEEDDFVFLQGIGNDALTMELEQDCEDCDNAEVLINDLIIYMPLAEGAYDLISGFNAQNSTNAFVEDRQGNSSCAMAFTGNDTFEIPVNTNNQLIQGDSFSISLWFKMQNTTVGDLEIFFRSPGNASQGFQLGVYDLNTPLFFDNLGTSLWDNDWNGEVDVEWQNTDWHHLVITVDATNTLKLYRDGVLRNNIDNSNFSVGSQAPGEYIIGEGFIGHLDDLRVYKRTLSANEVETLFNLDGDCYTCL
ncbi:LamG domain-containing protein [Lacinutrix cladophorae]